jgi:hypothetical protein
MTDADRFKLLGTYRMPRFRLGQMVRCAIRGQVVITGITKAPIPWPVAKKGKGRHTLVLYKDLAKAVRRESAQAVCHWWGICKSTVWQWRKALGVEPTNEGTSRLRRDHFAEPWGEKARRMAWAKAQDLERGRKISDAHRAALVHPEGAEEDLAAQAVGAALQEDGLKSSRQACHDSDSQGKATRLERAMVSSLILAVARHALAVGSAALPLYAHKFSPKTYTQPQLFSTLSLFSCASSD